MTQLLLIRHAKTDLAGTFCGHSDPDLNAQGWAQVERLIAELERHPIERVYTSDLLRAQQTARSIARHFGVECHVRAGLREIHFGRWEGLPWSEIALRDLGEANRWIKEYPHGNFPDGEDMHCFDTRVRREIEFLIGESGNKPVAVVTHGGVIRAVLTQFAQVSPEEAWQRTREHAVPIPIEVPSDIWKPQIEVPQ
jgi:alpha-ribazole phosphatase/probable phosphoglycerate mutase